MGNGHRTCHHHRLVADAQLTTTGKARRLPPTSRFALPAELWPRVSAAVTDGLSLRVVAAQYGVSRECVRRILRAGLALKASSGPPVSA